MKKQIMNLGIMGVLLMLSSILFYSCKKDNPDLPNSSPVSQWDNSAMTKASFTGQILKEDGSPLDGATVSTGMHSITTDTDGFFYFSDISTPQRATVLKVEMTGYFKAFKTIQVIPNQDNQTKIMIMELPVAKTFDASVASSITIDNGGSINFPANAIVDANTNQLYTGTVNVYAKWIDPSSSDLAFLTPGALRGINDVGREEGLTTYGMQAVELTGSAGQPLQLGNGQQAAVTFPLPSSLSGVAPATVPLWHLDENNGMWVEEGVAYKTGTDYVGSVSHFSFWNCDYGGEIVNFTCQLVDANNIPVSGAIIKLIPTSSTLTPRISFSNSSGTVSGGLPVNTTFDMEYIPAGCSWSSTPTFIQSFSATTTNVNLGTITVTNTASNSVLTGTVEDCSNNILANAPVKLVVGSDVFSGTTNASGQFNFTVNCLSSATSGVITAYDVSNAVNGSATVTLPSSGTTNAGAVAACGTLNQFITWSSNDGTTTLNASIQEGSSLANFGQSYQLNTYLYASDSNAANRQYISIDFDGPQTVAGTHNLINHHDYLDASTTQNILGVPLVTLTQYQAIGGFIEGSYTATISSASTPSRVVNCSFRVKRQQ